MHAELRGEPETAASRWLLMMLALILLGVMHIVLPSTGGSGADLPEPLLVWGLPCYRSRYSTPCMNMTARILSGFLFCSRPGT